MSDFLSSYSIQHWLEACPQGYLEGTQYGHRPGEGESELLLANPILREDAIRTTVQLVVGERCALSASSGLVNLAPDQPSRLFLATQTLDEARHVEIFTQRLYDLGVAKKDLDSTIKQYSNPHLIKFAEVLLDKIDKGDFIAGVVGQNIVLEGMAFTVFEMLHAVSSDVNPKFAHTLEGTIADERRHVGFGENRIGSLIRDHPERKSEIERMQRDMSRHMLATFASSFAQNAPAVGEAKRLRAEATAAGLELPKPPAWHGADLIALEPDDIEHLLADTVVGEFKTRLARIGLEYQAPRAA